MDAVDLREPEPAVDLSVRRLVLGIPPLELAGDVAVLAAQVAQAQRQFDRYKAFYQGDAVTVQPVFARGVAA